MSRRVSGEQVSPRRPLGPNGEHYCRRCGNEITEPRRTTFCSQACVDEHLAMTGTPDPGMLKRDRGRCAACGIDALALLAALKEMRWAVIEALKYGHHHYALYGSQAPAWLEFLAGIGLTDHDVFTRRRLWDADHIRAVSEGGGNVLENLQTLCLPCHRAKTRMWHGARAEQRRARIEVLEQAWRQGVLV